MTFSNYSSLDQHLHNQFLGNTEISNFLYERIKRYKKPKNKIQKIFICGLARAGTTSLLNQLYLSNQFASLKYAHMPFILNPRLSNLYSKLINNKNLESIERLHKDGIKISIESPECLDEPFWIKENPLYFSQPISVNRKYKNKTLSAYDNFLSRHAIFQKKNKILIKNNNNLLRLPQLCKYFKDDLFIVLYRDPSSHALSLEKTHQRICEAQKKDPFILEYMNLIGHREFGLNQQPFYYEITDDQKKSIIDTNEKLNYWFQSWINSYGWLLEYLKLKKPKNLLLTSYEELCQPNNIKLEKIFKLTGVNKDCRFILKNKNKNKFNIKVDKDLNDISKLVYSNLYKLD